METLHENAKLCLITRLCAWSSAMLSHPWDNQLSSIVLARARFTAKRARFAAPQPHKGDKIIAWSVLRPSD